MRVIDFTAHHEDLSTNRGYQFKFYCDKCGNGYMSRFQPWTSSTTGNLLRAAGDIVGGILASASSGGQVQRSAAGKAHETAREMAIGEAKAFFSQCSRCGRWVCADGCWNGEAGLCEECSPRSG
jgi:hypothetical protein